MEIHLTSANGGFINALCNRYAKGPMMIANNTNPGFKIDLHIKDLNNVMETAHKNGAPVPLTSMVLEMLENLHASGMGQCDHSALAKYYEKLADDTIY